jgi:hypothetical protein
MYYIIPDPGYVADQYLGCRGRVHTDRTDACRDHYRYETQYGETENDYLHVDLAELIL